MCGLVGCAGDLGPRSNSVFRWMLEFDTVRGEDSTGVMVHNNTGSQIFKAVDVPWYGLYGDIDYHSAMDDPTNNLYIGHNRAATTGAVTADNAHPFNYGHIWGAHNGTLTNISQLDDHKSFDVDSKALFSHMAANGVEHAIRNVGGAYSLVWYDENENTINFLRNSQRPLFFAFSRDNGTLFWASEYWMIDRAAKKEKITMGTIHSTQEMCHYRIELPPTEGVWTLKRFGKMRVKKLKPFRYKNIVTQLLGRNLLPTRHSPTTFGPPTKQLPIVGGAVIHAANFQAANSDTYKELYRNKEVMFVIEAALTPVNSAPYIRGYLIANKEIEVRLNPKFDSDRWKKFNNPGSVFLGRVKKLKGYILINLSSVKTTEEGYLDTSNSNPFLDSEDTYYLVRDGDKVDKEEFLRLIDAGCCVCGDVITEEDELDLDWYGDFPVCDGCSIDEVVDR